MLNETCQLTWKTPHNDAGRSLARTIELRIVSCNNPGSETKTGAGKKEKRDISFIPSYFHLKDVYIYFLSHHPVTAGRLTGTVNPKSLPAHQLATIYSFVSLRLKFNLLGRLMSGSGRSCDLKDIGCHQGGTLYAACASRQSSCSFGETW